LHPMVGFYALCKDNELCLVRYVVSRFWSSYPKPFIGTSAHWHIGTLAHQHISTFKKAHAASTARAL